MLFRAFDAVRRWVELRWYPVGRFGQLLSLMTDAAVVILVLGTVLAAFWDEFRNAPTWLQVVLACAAVVLVLQVIGAAVRQRPGRLSADTLDCAGKLVSMLRSRAAVSAVGRPENLGDDWLRTARGSDNYQRKTLSLYYDHQVARVRNILNEALKYDLISLGERRLAQQPRSVEDLWRIAVVLDRTYRDLEHITDRAFDSPYTYDDPPHVKESNWSGMRTGHGLLRLLRRHSISSR